MTLTDWSFIFLGVAILLVDIGMILLTLVVRDILKILKERS